MNFFRSSRSPTAFGLIFLGLSITACSLPSQSLAQNQGRLEQESITVGSTKRTYLLYVPNSYRSGKPVPLLLVFHGGGGSAKGMAKTTHFDQLAQSKGFIVAFPNGTGKRGNQGGTWNAGGFPPQGSAEKSGVDDLGFVRELIKTLSSKYAIDRGRIYAAGLSKGGMLTYHLACKMPDTFAAVAVVAGTLTSKGCKPSGTTALLHIHGTADENVPMDGGRGAGTARGANWPSPKEGVEEWRRANKCERQREKISSVQDTTCWKFKGCAPNKEVTYCLVEKGGHAWPGAEPKNWQKKHNIYVSQYFHATDRIWEFFEAHHK